MPNFANSKIYKMVSFNLPGLPYYGSTTQTLSKRKGKHVSDFKKYGLDGGGCTSRIVMAAGDYDIIWVEDFPCERKDQLKARERYYIENNVCVNKNIPGRTRAEWEEANPMYQKEYYQKNTEKCKGSVKKWNEANPAYQKEYMKEWRQANPTYAKEWQQANPTYRKEYYLANVVDQRARKSEQIQCTVCNCMTGRDQFVRHQQSAKCKRAGLLIAGAQTNCQC
jgi:hypothetical protein